MTEKPFYKRHPLALAVFVALNSASLAHAINFTGSYTQNFDTLASTGTSVSWTNDTTLSGWYLLTKDSNAISTYATGTGSVATGSFYSFGATSASDRALGGAGSANTYFGTPAPASGAIAGWIAFSATNGTGSTINTLNIGFNGEQWRNGGNANAQTMVLEYGFGTTFASVTTWNTPGSTFDWASPIATATAAAAAVDGNVAGLVGGKGGTLNSLNWTNGSTLWIRWVERNDTGNDHGLAIDNFSMTTAAGVTVTQSGGNTTVTEGGATDTYTVVLNSQPTSDVTVTLNSGTQLSTNSTTLTFTSANWNIAQTVTVTAVDDAVVEGTHTGTITHSATSSDSNYNNISIAQVTANISDNDTNVTPNLSINDVTQTEGNSGTSNFVFTVSLDSAAPTGGVSFNIATADATATAGSDYVTQSTSQTIPAGSTSATFTVAVNGDTSVESNETFNVNVSNVTGATVTDGQGVGTITNDDVASACGNLATKISAVQGTGATTPLNGVSGTVIEGIVIGDYQGNNGLKGFFVQEEDGDADGNPATSEGVFIFEDATNFATVNVGDKVRVTGTPGESFTSTQLSSITNIEVCATNQTMPTISALTLPVPNVPNGNLANANTAINNYFEPFEGMLVKFPATLKVSEYFELERFGQLVLSQGGRIPTYTNVSDPSTTGYINHQIKLAKRQIILDDGIDGSNFYTANPTIPLPYPTNGLSITNRFRGGDSISNLSGVLQYAFSQWRIRPVEEKYDYFFTATNPRKATAPNVGGTLKVVSENVLNFFTTLDTAAGNCGPVSQDCRGANSTAEYNRQLAKLTQAVCGTNADIYGFMELENNATTSLNAIKTAANAISGCGPFDYINTGVIGTDAIKVGFMYKTSTVAPVGAFKLLDSTVDARFIDTKNRPSLAQTFKEVATNETFTVVANHLKSKGSACTDLDANDGQGNCNLTRKAAAEALMDWVASSAVNGGDPDVLLIGDMNSYAKEDPIKAMEKGSDDNANTSDDYTNLIKAFNGDKSYSYVFDGQTGYLDHAIASPSLLPQVTGAKDWHINADEPPSFDYNDTVKDSREASFDAKPAALNLYNADQYRTSDHDPVVIGLKLTETINIINGTAAKNTLTGTTGKDRITGFAGADTLTGGMNNDVFVFTSPTDGIDTITDFILGEDKIDLAALLLSVGYEGNNPIADGYVKFATSGSNVVVYIDADGAGSAAQRALILVRNVTVSNLNNVANFTF